MTVYVNSTFRHPLAMHASVRQRSLWPATDYLQPLGNTYIDPLAGNGQSAAHVSNYRRWISTTSETESRKRQLQSSLVPGSVGNNITSDSKSNNPTLAQLEVARDCNGKHHILRSPVRTRQVGLLFELPLSCTAKFIQICFRIIKIIGWRS